MSISNPKSFTTHNGTRWVRLENGNYARAREDGRKLAHVSTNGRPDPLSQHTDEYRLLSEVLVDYSTHLVVVQGARRGELVITAYVVDIEP